LDTHTLLWWLADDPQLGRQARTLVKDARNTVMVSAASAWEISIKKAIGKLEAPEGLSNLIEDEGFESLPITFFHGERAGTLPLLHRDPFDRMLVAQAQAEGLDVITSDDRIQQYGVQTVDARS
jgi:PIN domain nuclease of toxin-antitoxin system